MSSVQYACNSTEASAPWCFIEPDLQVYKSAVQQGKDFAKEKDFLVTFLKSQIGLLVIHLKTTRAKFQKGLITRCSSNTS